MQVTSEFIKNVYMNSLYVDLAPFSDLPGFGEDDPMVFPKGTYTITEYTANVNNFPVSLQDGTYRVEIFLSKDGAVQSGFIIYWKVYPEVG